MEATTIKKSWNKPTVQVLTIKDYTHSGAKQANKENNNAKNPTSS